MVRLYHFTSRQKWAQIADAGQISPLYPQVNFEPPIPRTVHLTSSAAGSGLPHGISREVRMTVALHDSEVLPHLEWVRKLPPEAGPSLTGAVPLYRVGEPEDPSTWFVVEQPVSVDRWYVVVDMASGERLWP